MRKGTKAPAKGPGVKSKLPAKAPRRSGKRGIGPAEEVEAVDSKKAAGNDVELENPEDLKPRQARLPEMEDEAIEELEAAAEKLYEVRKERMALTTREVDAADLLLVIMKRHGKESYKRDGIEAKHVISKEKVRVRIKRDE